MSFILTGHLWFGGAAYPWDQSPSQKTSGIYGYRGIDPPRGFSPEVYDPDKRTADTLKKPAWKYA